MPFTFSSESWEFSFMSECWLIFHHFFLPSSSTFVHCAYAALLKNGFPDGSNTRISTVSPTMTASATKIALKFVDFIIVPRRVRPVLLQASFLEIHFSSIPSCGTTGTVWREISTSASGRRLMVSDFNLLKCWKFSSLFASRSLIILSSRAHFHQLELKILKIMSESIV